MTIHLTRDLDRLQCGIVALAATVEQSVRDAVEALRQRDVGLARRVIAAAELAAGEPPLLVPGLGGSLPLYLFTGLLGKPAVIVPMANHDDNQHAPDENLRLANLWYGIDLMTALLNME